MKKLLAILALLLASGLAQAFDHDAWDALLKRHVVLVNEGNTSLVDFADMLSDRAGLKSYLNALSAVTDDEYRRWPVRARIQVPQHYDILAIAIPGTWIPASLSE